MLTQESVDQHSKNRWTNTGGIIHRPGTRIYTGKDSANYAVFSRVTYAPTSLNALRIAFAVSAHAASSSIWSTVRLNGSARIGPS